MALVTTAKAIFGMITLIDYTSGKNCNDELPLVSFVAILVIVVPLRINTGEASEGMLALRENAVGICPLILNDIYLLSLAMYAHK